MGAKCRLANDSKNLEQETVRQPPVIQACSFCRMDFSPPKKFIIIGRLKSTLQTKLIYLPIERS